MRQEERNRMYSRCTVPMLRCTHRWLSFPGLLDTRCLCEPRCAGSGYIQEAEIRKTRSALLMMQDGSVRLQAMQRRLTEVHDVIPANGTLLRAAGRGVARGELQNYAYMRSHSSRRRCNATQLERYDTHVVDDDVPTPEADCVPLRSAGKEEGSGAFRWAWRSADCVS